MKTNERNMKTILTEWKKFLKENEEKYFPWLQYISGDNFEDVNASIVRSKKFIKIGEGGFRTVFMPIDDSQHVIKLSHNEHLNFTNEIEKILNIKYPNLFPKVYVSHSDLSHPDFLWIVSEACDVLNFDDEINDNKWRTGLTNSCFMLLDHIKTEIFTKYSIENNIDFTVLTHFMIYEMILDAALLGTKGSETKGRISNYTVQRALKIPANRDLYKKIINEIFEYGLEKEIWFSELTEVIQRFGVDIYDLKLGNVGLSLEDSSLKFIDASVFDKGKAEYF